MYSRASTAGEKIGESIFTVGQVTFAQHFANTHTAEVILNNFGKSVNEVMDDNVLASSEIWLRQQGLTDNKRYRYIY